MLRRILYFIWVTIISFLIAYGVKSGNFAAFLDSIENRTFDIKQRVLVKSGLRNPNKDIVIVAIDDASYEYILDNYGEWPLRRDIYAKIVDYIEQQHPKSIAFDLMFVKSIKSEKSADNKLSALFKKYDNVYTAMNLDDQPIDLRFPPVLPENLQISVNDTYNQTYDYLEYSNCRTILEDILDSTSNIGMVNVSRADDGVLRKMPLFLKYKYSFYPQLGLLVGLDYLGLRNNMRFTVLKDGRIKLDKTNKMFHAQYDGGVYLNWYGPAGTFKNIPIYKLLKVIDGKEQADIDFKGKVVYFGATAASLFDIKTVPVDKVYPGVEVQATYVNNIIDDSLIQPVPEYVNLIFAILLAIITIFFVIRMPSIFVAIGSSLTMYTLYIIFTYGMMSGMWGGYYWVKIVYPLTLAFFAFIATVVIKYLTISKDFDRQYQLATTDGLTELYNHRYFQEQMQMAVENARRYNADFSLIIIDIDFFKNFNDNYGHQAGDAVLRQVASTLKANVRITDIVCRYGGEEMSIILPNTPYDIAVSIANKLCRIVAEMPFDLNNGKEGRVTISLGVSAFGEQDGKTPEELVSAADARLYNAKNNGRNRVN
ncbi:diguanylate cyclase [bacterium]|nr:diguanylate cyclase [bacterium]